MLDSFFMNRIKIADFYIFSTPILLFFLFFLFAFNSELFSL